MTYERPQTPSDRARTYLQAYFDGQLEDEALRREIEERLQRDAELRREWDALSEMRTALHSLPKPAAPAYLRDRVLTTIREGAENEDSEPAAAEEKVATSWSRRARVRTAGWAVAAVLFATLSLNVLLIDREPEPEPINVPAFVEDHIVLTQNNGAGLLSNRPNELESWFSERLDFRPVIPEWNWLSLNAGCICYIDGARTARVEYINGSKISLFIRPPKGASPMAEMGATSPSTAIVEDIRGFRVACWTDDGMEYIMVASMSDAGVIDRLTRQT